MIEELTRKVLFDLNVPDVATLGLGVSAGTVGAVDLMAEAIDIFSTAVGSLLGVAGLIVTILTAINIWHKRKQIKIKTIRDQVELEKARLELAQLRKTYKAQKD